MAQGGDSAAAVAETGGGVTQVDASGRELADRIVPQRLDVKGHSGGPGDLGDLVGYPVGIPGPFVKRVGREHISVQRKFDADLGQLIGEGLAVFGEHGDGDLLDREAAVLMRFGVFPDFGATGDAVAVRDAEDAALQVRKPALALVAPLETSALAVCGNDRVALQAAMREAVASIKARTASEPNRSIVLA